jgi:hypothetical protein
MEKSKMFEAKMMKSLGRSEINLRDEVFNMRKRLHEIEKTKERAIYEQKEKARMEAELKKVRQIEFEKKELERKTKKYFYYDEYNRRKQVDGESYFVGEIETKHTSWLPDGPGKYFDYDYKVLDGNFKKGEFVSGEVFFPSNRQTWKGGLKNNAIHGPGIIIHRKLIKFDERIHDINDFHLPNLSTVKYHSHNGDHNYYQCRDENSEFIILINEEKFIEIEEVEEAIAYQGKIVCCRKDLVIGQRLQFFGDHFAHQGVSDNLILSNRLQQPKATIIKYHRNWKYYLRFDDELWPRERVIDLSHIIEFRLLQTLPFVYHIHAFDSQLNQEHNNVYTKPISTEKKDDLNLPAYHIYEYSTIPHPDEARHLLDYRAHLHQKLERPLLPQLPSRKHEERRENYFETRMMGIGAALEEDKLKQQSLQKQEQFQKFLMEKRQKYMEEKQKQLAEEQSKAVSKDIDAAKNASEEMKKLEADQAEKDREEALKLFAMELNIEEEEEEEKEIK